MAISIFYFKSEATKNNKDRLFQVHMDLDNKNFSLFDVEGDILCEGIFERQSPFHLHHDEDETEEERLFREEQEEWDEGEEEPLQYDSPLGKWGDEKVVIFFNDGVPNVAVKVLYECVEYDRCTSSYWEWYDALPITEEEYNKEIFKTELMALLKRYNQKDIGRKGTLTERIQRLYKKNFGHNIPPIRIGDLA